MIASHYADPLTRHLVTDAALRLAPSDDADLIANLTKGSNIVALLRNFKTGNIKINVLDLHSHSP